MPAPPGESGSWRLPDAFPRTETLALGVWTALIVLAAVWGNALLDAGRRIQVGAPPLTGAISWRFTSRVVPSVLVAGVVASLGPRVARTIPFRAVVALCFSSACVWALSLSFVDGWGAFVEPLRHTQYLQTAAQIHGIGPFLSTFVARITTYNIHTQGHPPGMVVVMWILARAGIGTAGWNAVLVLLGGAAGISAALVALREVVGEVAARAAASFLVLAPAMMWWSSGDAFFAGVSAWAVTLVVLATGRSGARSDVLALAGGVLFGVTAFLSYGLVLLAVIPLAVAFDRRRARPLVVAALGSLPVFVAFGAAGFSWLAGLAATRGQYFAGVARRRPYRYFAVADLAAFALALGPAVAVALARLRGRAAWLLVGAGLTGVALADVSGMAKGEVERIWLPFVPWVMLATVAFASRRGTRTVARRRAIGGTGSWLALQACSALVLQTAVRSPW